jgi:hypothetical protein
LSCHINAVVLDDNNYFSQGIQLLLMQYITRKGWSAVFLPEKQLEQADLVIQADNYCHPMRFCHIQARAQDQPSGYHYTGCCSSISTVVSLFK